MEKKENQIDRASSGMYCGNDLLEKWEEHLKRKEEPQNSQQKSEE